MSLTYELANEYFDYDPETGLIRWKKDKGHVKAGSVTGCIDSNGYRLIGFNGKRYHAHRIAYLLMEKEWPQHEIDHKCGNKADNRWSEIRPATRSENCKNRSLRKDNTSGMMGVTLHKPSKKWQVSIKYGKKQIYLGYYKDKNEAIKIRKQAEILYGYHENHGR